MTLPVRYHSFESHCFLSCSQSPLYAWRLAKLQPVQRVTSQIMSDPIELVSGTRSARLFGALGCQEGLGELQNARTDLQQKAFFMASPNPHASIALKIHAHQISIFVQKKMHIQNSSQGPKVGTSSTGMAMAFNATEKRRADNKRLGCSRWTTPSA